MKITHAIATAAMAAAFVMPTSAFSQTAIATTDLNMRAGPGPEFPVVGGIAANGTVTIHGCTEGGNWCDVTAGASRGWSYAEYLAYDASGGPVAIIEADREIPVVTYETEAYWDAHYRDRSFYEQREVYLRHDGGGALTGMAGGAATGALIGGPIGAAVGGAAGAALGAIVEPPSRVQTYVVEQQPEPVVLEGEVVVGAGVPEPVALYEVPDYDYQYAYVNGQYVLVEPASREIVYVYR